MGIVLGALSGLLLAFGVPPFSAPFFSLLAFAPLIFLAAKKPFVARRQLLTAGAVAGGIAAFSMSYYVFHDFAWPPDSPTVLTFIRWSPILWALLGAIAGGFGLVLYRTLRSPSLLQNAALGASIYALLEQSMQLVTGHYYLWALAYSAAFLPASFLLASLGGELLVSFSVAFIGALLGELMAAERPGRMRALWQTLALFAGVAILCTADAYYLYGSGASAQNLRVAAIQTGSRDAVAFAHDYDGTLSFPALASKLGDTAAQGSNLIVYPLAVVNEVLYTDAPPVQGYGQLKFLPRSALESWMRANAPASSTVVTWDITYQGGEYLQNYDFWSAGGLASSYSKRRPYAFTEYTPSFAHLGFGPTPAPISAGQNDGLTTLQSGITLADLQCSEVHLPSLASEGGKRAQLFLAIGLEWIFPADMGEEYSLEAAQYRAAENNIPAVRATAEGPSALIDAHGKIIERLDFNETGVLAGMLAISQSHRSTLYAYLGDYPLYAGIAALFLLAGIRLRKKFRFPGTRG